MKSVRKVRLRKGVLKKCGPCSPWPAFSWPACRTAKNSTGTTRPHEHVFEECPPRGRLRRQARRLLDDSSRGQCGASWRLDPRKARRLSRTADQQTTPTSVEESQGAVAGVLITTPDIHLRGMDRNTVIVDGDKAGAPESCDPDAGWQDFGITANGTPYGGTGTTAVNKPFGRNGIVVFKDNGVSIENLTVCNSFPVRELGQRDLVERG